MYACMYVFIGFFILLGLFIWGFPIADMYNNYCGFFFLPLNNFYVFFRTVASRSVAACQELFVFPTWITSAVALESQGLAVSCPCRTLLTWLDSRSLPWFGHSLAHCLDICRENCTDSQSVTETLLTLNQQFGV